MNILHIDTSLMARMMTKTAVEETNNNYFGTDTIAEAIQLLEETKFDLIITALQFYNISGIDTIKKIMEKTSDSIPIMVLTSDDNIQLRQKIFNLGIVNFQLKRDFNANVIKHYIKSTEMNDILTNAFLSARIAIVDDSITVVAQVKKIFEMNGIHNIDCFYNAQDLLKSDMYYDIYIIDFILPDSSGDILASKIRTNNSDSIIIMISSISNNNTISLVLSTGSDDFIVKPFDPSLFILRIKTHMKNRLLLMELDSKNNVLEKMAITDGLTNIYNHRYILGKLEEEVYRAKRYESTLSIILLDLDKFKAINDTFGHQSGDLVLRTTAQTIDNSIRVSDTVGRYGGEEFLVILPNTNADQAYLVAEKIRSAVECTKYKDAKIVTTISGGVSAYTKEEDYISLIKKADDNMYKAKADGRNRIV